MSQLESEYKYPVDAVGGVTFDGENLWIGCVSSTDGPSLAQVNPQNGEILKRMPATGAAGNAWDGKNLWQVANKTKTIQCLNSKTGTLVREIPSPEGKMVTGLTWDGEALWAGTFDDRRIFKLDPETGKVLKIIRSDRFVTGVAWVGPELWHAVYPEKDSGLPAELRQIDHSTGEVKRKLVFPHVISGLAHDGEKFWCGDCDEAKLRAIRI